MNREDFNKLKYKLPAIPGINGREDYFNSAVLALLMIVEEEYYFVFQKRNKKIRQGGEICFPGGKQDKKLDKNAKDTAIRETIEEMGIGAEDIEVVGALDILVVPMGAIVEPFLAITHKQDIGAFVFNEEEVEEVFILPVAYFRNNPPKIYKTLIKVHPSYIDGEGNEVILFPSKALGLGEYYTNPWGRSESTVLVYKTEKGVIWGLTARIIQDVVKRLEETI
ncbi:MAG: pyrophosphohydrolase [Clostridia bacterium]|jgi:8-oxo-dGTP pyrophosphatase MutT (NUDIX family)|nr:pyrophosphohydrolase [Clostridia bacterium]